MTPELFTRLETSWRKDADACDLEFEPGWMPFLEHAQGIIEKPQPRYGIYAMAQVTGDGKVIRPPYDRIVHVNHKLPKTKHSEVRFVWTQTSPHLVAQREETTAGEAVADYMLAAMHLAETDFNCRVIRLYLPDRSDQTAARFFARILDNMRQRRAKPGTDPGVAKLEVRVVPQWLIVKF